MDLRGFHSPTRTSTCRTDTPSLRERGPTRGSHPPHKQQRPHTKGALAVVDLAEGLSKLASRVAYMRSLHRTERSAIARGGLPNVSQHR